jgi:transcriptional regulator with XRE-family HTH domain
MKSEEQIAREMGLRLRKARIEARMTQKEMAVRAGIGLNRLGDMERGRPTTSLVSWIKVSRLLGLEKAWDEVLAVQENPFEEYDRRMAEQDKLLKTRVRKKKKKKKE